MKKLVSSLVFFYNIDMAMRKLKNKQIRNIQKSGGTYYITIPIEIIRNMSWRERQKVEVKQYGKNKILISDWK